MNENSRQSIGSTLSHWHNVKVKLMIEGIIVGFFAGLLVVAYRLALEKAEELRHYFFEGNSSSPLMIAFWFIILLAGGLVVGRMIVKEPLISGSGIPQVEAILRGKLSMNWLSVFIRKFVGGVISIGAGLSLGREGPSIQLGASVGQGVSRVLKRAKVEEKYLITSGASAGLAAAFNAPLAGVMFALEEVHKHFSPLVLLSAMSASLTADVVSKNFFGLKPVFNFNNIIPLPLRSYGYIVILGVLVGLFGVIFNSTLLKSLKLYGLQKWLPVKYRPLIPFIMAGILALIFPKVLGGGHAIIDSLISDNVTVKALLIILLVKYVYTMISYGSGAPGGIFFPLLVLGALTGSIYGNIIIKFLGFDSVYLNNFIILAMAGYFAAIVRAPITGSILITEMTGSFTHLLSLSIISIVAYAVADLLGSEPVYDSLLHRLLKNNGKSEVTEDNNSKLILEIPVFLDSMADGRTIKDIIMPKECLLVAIKRGEKEIIPRGDTKVYSGDYLHVLVNESRAASVNEDLMDVCGKPDLE